MNNIRKIYNGGKLGSKNKRCASRTQVYDRIEQQEYKRSSKVYLYLYMSVQHQTHNIYALARCKTGRFSRGIFVEIVNSPLQRKQARRQRCLKN